MKIELSTIPLYLYPMYSCKSSADAAPQTIRGIVVQEMLHLVLAGNILIAVGGTPTLYEQKEADFMKYPGPMIDRLPVLNLSLRELDQTAIDMYIQVELRSDDPPSVPPADNDDEHYHTLDEFYHALQKLTEELAPGSFQPSLQDLQISQADNVYFGDGLQTILQPADAVQAMQTIIDQGEGAVANDPSTHIYKFQHMVLPPSGTYNVPLSPQTSDYKTSDGVYAVSQLFDASFCYLLLTIETLWQTPPGDKRTALGGGNTLGIMTSVLSPLANWLVLQTLPSGTNAAPCFNYFDFVNGAGGVKNALNQLIALGKALPSGPAGDSGVQAAVQTIGGLAPLN